MCNYENQSRSLYGGEGKETEVGLFRPEGLKDAFTGGEKVKMEKEIERTSCPERERRVTMNKANIQNAMEQSAKVFYDLDFTYGFEELLSATTNIANRKLPFPVDKWTVAIIMASFADAKIAITPDRLEPYRELMMWLAVAADQKDDKGNQMPRVQASIESALSLVNVKEPA
jgi:hypothetical protein